MACPTLSDCRALAAHLEVLREHGLTCLEWAALLLVADAREYREPPLPTGPAVALTAEARVEVYRQRAARKQSLYHPGDSWRQQTNTRACVEAGRSRNGAVYGRGVTHG